MPYLDRSDWTAKVTDAGLTAERTEAEWVAHPYALDDLLRVLGGTKLAVLGQERRILKELDAA